MLHVRGLTQDFFAWVANLWTISPVFFVLCVDNRPTVAEKLTASLLNLNIISASLAL